MRVERRLAVAMLFLLVAGPVGAAEYYVAPDGQPENRGTRQSPWDIESAWQGHQRIEPGATLYMLEGVYRHPKRTWSGGQFEIRLSGEAGAPVHIRPLPGDRVTIDGGVTVANGTRHLWIWELEITVSEAADWDRRVPHAGADPRPDRDHPAGGLTIHGGENSKFINLVVHGLSSTGVSFWRGAVDAELHGCLIYDNGLIATDRYHGPGIYTQNQTGQKWITDNILWGNYSTTIQAYGSERAFVNGYRIVGNIAFAPLKQGGRAGILVGGGRPSEDIVVRENLLYEVPLRVGYTAPYNEDAVVQDNVLLKTDMSITRFRRVEEANNRLVDGSTEATEMPQESWLRPNKYDPDRAHLAVANGRRAATVDVDLSGFLGLGDAYRIVSALDFYGQPLAEGIYDGGPLALPVPAVEATGQGEFCAYVVFRTR
jgi:hypothetical protein